MKCLTADFAAALEQVEGAVDIGADIKPRVGNRRPHAGAGGEVEHHVERDAGEQRVHQRRVPDVALDQGDAVAETREVRLLDRGIVEVVEIIDHDEFGTFGEQRLAKMGRDETGTAGDEDFP